ncbi:MAG TPA: type I DNA topoisomerase [Candidatus Faeciplasma pullistercoris]|uniref:DNA topoisomerase 1 n=1 Tax=Candidatus Faeciplasma pullistercoris TaxID=2840800 RepID=A0A9D1KM20_9FIRM|nr:type I DNA topoisomerase [Candidatus Faeciplasma pullistercoris]
MSDLIIVESPTKIHTVKRTLGAGYNVVACAGHVRDLPKSKLAVDVDNGFEPTYVDIAGKENIIKDIKKLAKKSDHVYFATDPDREGEAISWHLACMLGFDLNDKNRVTFNEITKTGVEAGIAAPRKIDMNIVNAQQARRILDRIVGYKLSPFLWKKVRRGLSAGRVQSVAVRMIVDREKEIKSFKPVEYWSIEAKLSPKQGGKTFVAKLATVDGVKPELNCKTDSDAVLSRLSGAEFKVSSVRNGTRSKTPAAPFSTPTLLQDASQRLGFNSRRTMSIAQELYEGVDIEGIGAVGLITYMRTDSLRISDEAKAAAADFVRKNYGEEYLPKTARNYKSKDNNIQDAHEAIRPTMADMTPERVKPSLTTDQYKLYKLIWSRFIASQMADCVLNTTAASVEANGCVFKASGFNVRFDGYTVLYEESKEDSEESSLLPPLTKGETLELKSLDGLQHFTQPPARYTEATLIKAFKENGIARPSTYASTITTILQRSYVERDGKQLKPTGLGEVTTQLMEDNFKKIVDVKFTAEMESELDEIELGKRDWRDTLKEFYDGFDESLKKAEINLEGKRVKVPDEKTDQVCEICGKPMVIKLGRYGKFLACSGFPECTNTKKLVTETPGKCPYCGKRVLQKKTQKGKKYFGCEDNPGCKFMTWDTPTAEVCPKCSSTLFRKGGSKGKLVCYKPDCGYEKDLG